MGLNNKNNLTGRVGGRVFAVLAIIFLVTFSIIGYRALRQSEAHGDCTKQSIIKVDTSSKDSDKSHRQIVSDANYGSPTRRSYNLNTTALPGEYEVYTKSSDDHYSHRSSGPDNDKEEQPHEEYYVSMGGATTDKHTSDFTDFYDWHGSKSSQDDDNKISTMPPDVASDEGEFLGTITVTKSSNSVEFVHTGETDANVRHNENSVVPSSVSLKCVKNLETSLSLAKTVDGNGDGVFHTTEEITTDGTPFVWRLVGTNKGYNDVDNARIADTFPNGVTVQSVSSEDVGEATHDGNKVVWNGALDKGESVTVNVTLVVADPAAFKTCDDVTYTGNSPGDNKCYNRAQIGTAAADDPYGVVKPVSANSDVTAPTPAQLKIVKTVDANRDGRFAKLETAPSFSANVTWRIVATNTGSSSAAVIDDPLPAGVQGATVRVVSGGGAATLTQNRVTWSGALAANQSVTIDIKSTIANDTDFAACDRADGTVDIQCKNTASIGTQGVGGAVNVVASDSALVSAKVSTSVSVQKQVDGNNDGVYGAQEAAPVDGTPFRWRLVIKNQSAFIAKNARATDRPTAGLAYVPDSATASLGMASFTNGTVVWNGDVEAGGTVTVTFLTKFTSATDFTACDNDTSVERSKRGDNVCANEAIAGMADPSKPLEVITNNCNKATASVTRLVASNLSIITLSDGNDFDNDSPNQFSDTQPEYVLALEAFLWQVRGSNNGSSDEPNARVVAEIPAGLMLISNAQTVQVSGVAGGTVTIVTDSTTNRQSVVWTGNLPKGSTVGLTFSTVFSDKGHYDQCVAATAGTTCSLVGFIGKKGTTASGFNGPTLQDPAFVIANFVPVLVIEKSINAANDGAFKPVSDRAAIGRNIEWQVKGTNNGNETAVNVRIVDVFPGGTTKVTQNTSQVRVSLKNAVTTDVKLIDNYTGDRSAVVWTGTIEPSGSVTLGYTTVYTNEDNYEECLEVTTVHALCGTPARIGFADNANSLAQTVMADDAALIIDPNPMMVQKEVSASPTGPWLEKIAIAYDQPYYYRLRITNAGAGNVIDAAIYDSLPDGMIADAITSVTPANLGTASILSGTRFAVFWHAGVLAAGQSAEVVYAARVVDQGAFEACDKTRQYQDTQDGDCINYALAGTGTSLNSFSAKTNPDPAAVTAPPKAVINIDKTVEGSDADTNYTKQENIHLGEQFSWRIDVGNSGNLEADLVTMTDSLPTGLRMVSLATSGDTTTQAVYDANTRAITWTGSLGVGKHTIVNIITALDDQADLEACDLADYVKNGVCSNTANYTYHDDSGSSVAVVSTDDAPKLTILKQIDADMNGTFNARERMQLGRMNTWRVIVKNTGNVAAENVQFVDPIVPGVPVQAGDVKEVSGADFGSATLANGNLAWQGSLPAHSEVVVEYTGTFKELQEFATCNFSDGDTTDQLCLNTAKVGYIGMSGFLAESSASLFTDLPVILAYTGQSPTSVILLLALPLVLMILAVALLFRRRRNNTPPGPSPQPPVD